MRRHTDDENAFRSEDNRLTARLELIADALKLPDPEIAAALSSLQALTAFAKKHNQSLDWIIKGDVRSLILKASGRTASASPC
jgi:hypothetical protein